MLDCKVCGDRAPVFAAVDSARHCNRQVDDTESSGVFVTYYRCSSCGFVFSDFLDSFSPEDLINKIYNNEYIKFDPLYPMIRPKMNAVLLRSILDEALPSGVDVRVLDYGAGNGMLSALLEDRLKVENYDALNPRFDRMPDGKFDLVFSSEVVEHIPQPHAVMPDWSKLLTDQGAVLFSTMVQPADIASLREDWWYLGPRNGHVSLHSSRSLDLLCRQHGFEYHGLDAQWHLAWRPSGHNLDMAALQRIVDRQPKGFIEV